MQYLSTVDMQTLIRPFTRQQCVLLAMAMQVRKTFTTDVEQMQRQRHHMTTGGL